jgi:Aspartyl protease
MSPIKCLASVSLAIALSTLQAEPRCPRNVASLPLRLAQNSLIVVHVQINQSGPYDFVVDTGAQVTTIDSSLASELRLKLQGTTGVDGVATSTRTAYAYLEQLEAGTHAVPNSLAVIQDLAQLRAADPRIRGILGENFLAHFDLLIDNRQLILCLDDSDALAPAVKGKHVELAQPKGSREDLPFTRPIIVSARFGGSDADPVLLRLDSGSNAPVLYAADPRIRKTSGAKTSLLKRVVNGVEQAFAVLPAQDIQVGSQLVRQVSFVMPMNSTGYDSTLREDGLLPTMAFQCVFISYRDRYAAVEPW